MVIIDGGGYRRQDDANYVQAYCDTTQIKKKIEILNDQDYVLDFYLSGNEPFEKRQWLMLQAATDRVIHYGSKNEGLPHDVVWTGSYRVDPTFTAKDLKKIPPLFSLTKEQVLKVGLTDADTIEDFKYYATEVLQEKRSVDDFLNTFEENDCGKFKEYCVKKRNKSFKKELT